MHLHRKHKEWMVAYLFIAPPTVLGLYLFFLYPMVSSVFISFTKWNHLTAPEFIGLVNYSRLFKDSTIWLEFKNTMFFCIGFCSPPDSSYFSILSKCTKQEKIVGKRNVQNNIFFFPM